MIDTPLDTVNASDGLTSLREAILAANLNSDADEIRFAPALPTIFLSGIELPEIHGWLDIIGPGMELLAISGNHQSRVFKVAADASVFLSGLTIGEGAPIKTTGAAAPGGGIYNSGILEMNDIRISTNVGAEGGGIYNAGFASLTNSLVDNNNSPTGSGGRIYVDTMGELVVSKSRILKNTTSSGVLGGGNGGGICVGGGSAIVTQSTIGLNSAWGGPGIAVQGGTLSVERSTLVGNFGTGRYPATITIDDAGVTTLNNCTISDNAAAVHIRPGAFLDAQSVTIAANKTGIFNEGSITLNNSIVAQNETDIFDRDALSSSGSYNIIGDAQSSGRITNGVDHNIVGVDPLLAPLTWSLTKSRSSSYQTFATIRVTMPISAASANSRLMASPSKGTLAPLWSKRFWR